MGPVSHVTAGAFPKATVATGLGLLISGLHGNGGYPPSLSLGIRSCREQGPLSSLPHFISAAREGLES